MKENVKHCIIANMERAFEAKRIREDTVRAEMEKLRCRISNGSTSTHGGMVTYLEKWNPTKQDWEPL